MMTGTVITEAMLEQLRERVRTVMSDKRYAHTCAVERMVVRLGELYCPDQILPLRAAALLHDITKEETLEKQLQLCKKFDIIVKSGDRLAPKTFHARTAAALIERDFPEFASETVVSAVRRHTTGRAEMSLTDEIIYLADYIDDTRKFPDCVKLRSLFWDADPAAMDERTRLAHLRDVLIVSFDMTIGALLAEGVVISTDTIEARNWLLEQRSEA